MDLPDRSGLRDKLSLYQDGFAGGVSSFAVAKCWPPEKLDLDRIKDIKLNSGFFKGGARFISEFPFFSSLSSGWTLLKLSFWWGWGRLVNASFLLGSCSSSCCICWCRFRCMSSSWSWTWSRDMLSWCCRCSSHLKWLTAECYVLKSRVEKFEQANQLWWKTHKPSMYIHVYDNLSLLDITWFMNFVQIMGNKEANEKSPRVQNLEPNLTELQIFQRPNLQSN